MNLFDYSGELVNQKIDKDRLKKQAVLMDGFMLFLDPTQLYGDGANVTLDRQIVGPERVHGRHAGSRGRCRWVRSFRFPWRCASRSSTCS